MSPLLNKPGMDRTRRQREVDPRCAVANISPSRPLAQVWSSGQQRKMVDVRTCDRGSLRARAFRDTGLVDAVLAVTQIVGAAALAERVALDAGGREFGGGLVAHELPGAA